MKVRLRRGECFRAIHGGIAYRRPDHSDIKIEIVPASENYADESPRRAE